MKNIPKRLPLQILDRLVEGNSFYCDPMIQLELEFAEQLDAERLSRAIDLTLEAEPVLGSRLVRHWRYPYWELLEEDKRNTLLFTIEEDEYETFKQRSIDTYAGPQMKACLWHSSASDRLLLKVSHYASDAGGVKDVVAVVSSIYSRLANEPNYRQEPNLKGSRGIWQVMQRVPWYTYPRLYLRWARQLWASQVPSVTHTLPLEDGPHSPLVFVRRFVSADTVARLSQYRRVHNATLNDLMMAALFRALAVVGEWDRQTQLRLNTTVDLRRYLPGGRAEAVANLSIVAVSWPSLGTDLGHDLASTLARIVPITRQQKEDWLGVSNFIGLLPIYGVLPHAWAVQLYLNMAQWATKRRSMAHTVTNMGLISASSVTFGAKPLNAWLLPPPAYPPYFAAGLSGYAGSLTLSAGSYPSQRPIVEQLFDAVLSEFPG